MTTASRTRPFAPRYRDGQVPALPPAASPSEPSRGTFPSRYLSGLSIGDDGDGMALPPSPRAGAPERRRPRDPSRVLRSYLPVEAALEPALRAQVQAARAGAPRLPHAAFIRMERKSDRYHALDVSMMPERPLGAPVVSDERLVFELQLRTPDADKGELPVELRLELPLPAPVRGGRHFRRGSYTVPRVAQNLQSSRGLTSLSLGLRPERVQVLDARYGLDGELDALAVAFRCTSEHDLGEPVEGVLVYERPLR